MKYAVVERPDGSTFTQAYGYDLDDLMYFKSCLGDDYLIVDIYY